MLAPAVVGVGGLFLAALVLGLGRSLGLSPFGTGGAPTLQHYARALAIPGIVESALLTLAVAAVVTAAAAVLGVAAAVVLDRALRTRRHGRAAALLFQLNLTVPHVVAAVGMGLLVAQSGLLARIAHAAGWIDGPADFPALTHDPHGLGITLAYLWKEVPFIGAVVLSLLANLGEGPREVARTLGASRWQAFRHVTLPAILPGTLAASAMVFAFVLTAYEVPAVLGASHPKLLPVLATEMFTSSDIADRPAAVALTLMLSSACFLMIAGYRRLVALSGGAGGGR